MRRPARAWSRSLRLRPWQLLLLKLAHSPPNSITHRLATFSFHALLERGHDVDDLRLGPLGPHSLPPRPQAVQLALGLLANPPSSTRPARDTFRANLCVKERRGGSAPMREERRGGSAPMREDALDCVKEQEDGRGRRQSL
jgi:hypothetical protein